MDPRGIANCNPGNIRQSPTRWLGMCPDQKDPDFIQFTAPVFGIRALMRVVLNYYRLHGLKTIGAIIDRWAPPAENNTAAYISDIAARLDIDPADPLDVTKPENLIEIARGIIHHENGKNPAGGDWFAEGIYERAANLALQ